MAFGRRANLELSVIRTGEITTPHGYFFRANGNLASRLRAGLSRKGGVLVAPCLAYVVRHPAAGPILIDTGFHPDASRALRKDFGLPMSRLFNGLRPASRPFDDQLRELGLEPEGVGAVVITHLHVDHTSGMRLLSNAEFTCSRREWRAAHTRFAAVKGYARHHLPPQSRMRLVDFDADGEAYGPFARTIDLVGDGSIRLVSTPGHTPGHLSVLLHEVRGREVLLVGDAAYTVRAIREQILPMLTDDDATYARSLRALKAFADERPEAILVPTHDPQAWLSISSGEAYNTAVSGEIRMSSNPRRAS